MKSHMLRTMLIWVHCIARHQDGLTFPSFPIKSHSRFDNDIRALSMGYELLTSQQDLSRVSAKLLVCACAWISYDCNTK